MDVAAWLQDLGLERYVSAFHDLMISTPRSWACRAARRDAFSLLWPCPTLDAAPENGAGMAAFAAQLAGYCRGGASFDPATASPAEL